MDCAYRWGKDHDLVNVQIYPTKLKLPLKSCTREVSQSQFARHDLLKDRGYHGENEDYDIDVNIKSVFSKLIQYSPTKIYVYKIACSNKHTLFVRMNN